MAEISELFRAAELGALRLPNRVLMAPMTRSRADRAGVPARRSPSTTPSAPRPA